MGNYQSNSYYPRQLHNYNPDTMIDSNQNRHYCHIERKYPLNYSSSTSSTASLSSSSSGYSGSSTSSSSAVSSSSSWSSQRKLYPSISTTSYDFYDRKNDENNSNIRERNLQLARSYTSKPTTTTTTSSSFASTCTNFLSRFTSKLCLNDQQQQQQQQQSQRASRYNVADSMIDHLNCNGEHGDNDNDHPSVHRYRYRNSGYGNGDNYNVNHVQSYRPTTMTYTTQRPYQQQPQQVITSSNYNNKSIRINHNRNNNNIQTIGNGSYSTSSGSRLSIIDQHRLPPVYPATNNDHHLSITGRNSKYQTKSKLSYSASNASLNHNDNDSVHSIGPSYLSSTLTSTAKATKATGSYTSAMTTTRTNRYHFRYPFSVHTSTTTTSNDDSNACSTTKIRSTMKESTFLNDNRQRYQLRYKSTTSGLYSNGLTMYTPSLYRDGDKEPSSFISSTAKNKFPTTTITPYRSYLTQKKSISRNYTRVFDSGFDHNDSVRICLFVVIMWVSLYVCLFMYLCVGTIY